LKGGLACVYLMMIRAGRNLGGKSFFPSNAEEAEASLVLEAFLSQHYAGRPVPGLLVLGTAVEGMASFLSEESGHKIQVVAKPVGERRNWLRMAEHNAELALIAREGQRAGQEQRLAALNEVLGETTIQRIECFDVSHTMGEATVVSCVVYDNGGMQSSEYRRFNIDTPTPGDDYYAMRDALTRRYSKLAEGEGKRPDLLLIDGGRGQLNVALDVLNELGLSQVATLGVAKGEERKPGLEQLILPDEKEPLRLPPSHPALHLIQEVRDEAHRFAITSHRAKRAKKRVTSSLEDIPGIGPKRRQRLLQTFGGLRGLQSTGIEELAQVEGMSRELAEKLYRALH
jgi:excinuclease ABC subunit C